MTRSLSTPLRWLLRLATALGLAMLTVTATPVVFWWATALAGPWNDPTGEVLIVLTGSALDEHTIGMNSYWRAVYAARVFTQEHFQEVIISGGPPSGPAAGPMKVFLLAQSVPAAAIHTENASTNTRESAVNLAQAIARDPGRFRNRRLVLLTSDYHMWRSFRAFRKAGISVLPRPIPDARKRYSNVWERWGIFLELIQETAKIAFYWARGWLA